MSTIVGLILALVAIGLIGLPLLRRDGDDLEEYEEHLEPGDEPDLEKEKEGVFTALNELEYDFQMHKISEGDYKTLKNKLTREAISILKVEEEDESEDLKELELAIEQEVEEEIERDLERDLQGGRTAPTRSQPSRPVPRKDMPERDVPPQARYCGHCGGQLMNTGQKYCHLCGEKVLS